MNQIFPAEDNFLAGDSRYRKPEATGEQNV